MKTAITEMFGVKYPIICGAMMWLCKPNLCAAVSNAGGLGSIGVGSGGTRATGGYRDDFVAASSTAGAVGLLLSRFPRGFPGDGPTPGKPPSGPRP